MKKIVFNYPELDEILNNSPFVAAFLTYLEKRASNPTAIWDDINDESLRYEFNAKCQWIQHYAKTKLGISDITMELAATVVNSEKGIRFSKEISEKLFDGFLHYIVANETNSQVLNSLMKTWVAEGRSLTELDSNGITPLQTAVYTNNIASFSALASMGIDITSIDNDGLSPLHVIIHKIEDGLADISLLEAWVKAELPTNMVSGPNLGKWAGKTAIEFAEMKGLVKATEILGGNVELANVNLNALYSIKKDIITQSYNIKMDKDPLAKEIVAQDKNILLLNYLVDNYNEISSTVFAKFLQDKELGLDAKSNIFFANRTALQKCVELGYNDWALELAKAGIGTINLDNGINILNYCILYDNVDLLDKLLHEIDCTSLIIPKRQYTTSTDTAFPLTPLLHAVLEGKTEMVVKLAKAGLGTTLLDNTNHVLNYVRNFGGPKKIEMTKALAEAKIDVSSEKAQQALVSALHPVIDNEFASILIKDMGVSTEDILELFITHKLLPQVECLVMNGAELTVKLKEALAYKEISKDIEAFVDAKEKLVVKKPMTYKEKMQFILSHIVKDASLEDLIKDYTGPEKLGEQYINAFKHFKITQLEKPAIFEKMCAAYGVEISKIENKEIEISTLLSCNNAAITAEEDINTEIIGNAVTNDDE